MFTGIIESIGRIKDIENVGSNIRLIVESDISHELSIDQSVAHDGICLTIINTYQDRHVVDVIRESIIRSHLQQVEVGQLLNLERSMRLNDRLDGHIVQGHVDTTSTCLSREDQQGSFIYRFSLPAVDRSLVVEKGSICINGVSLTVSSLSDEYFEVSIIPYTYSHTNFQLIMPGSMVNIEYDILGKYVRNMLQSSLIK